MSQLRKLIAAAPPGLEGRTLNPHTVLATRRGGYAIVASEDSADHRVFDRLAREGHRAREDGNFLDASKLFSDALALWRGPALADVSVGFALDPGVRRLEESRRNVLDRRIDADLRIGRHHQVLGELRGLARSEPTHEGLHMQLMLALSRSGRRSEAVAVYRSLRVELNRGAALLPSADTERVFRSIIDPQAAVRHRRAS